MEVLCYRTSKLAKVDGVFILCILFSFDWTVKITVFIPTFRMFCVGGQFRRNDHSTSAKCCKELRKGEEYI